MAPPVDKTTGLVFVLINWINCFGWLLVINRYYFCLHMNNRRYGATVLHAVMLSANYIQYVGTELER